MRSEAQGCAGFSHGERFIAHEVEADDLWHGAGLSVAEMTADGVARHFAQLLDGFTLRGDGVAEGGGDKAAVVSSSRTSMIIARMAETIARGRESGQGPAWSPSRCRWPDRVDGAEGGKGTS